MYCTAGGRVWVFAWLLNNFLTTQPLDGYVRKNESLDFKVS